MTTRAKKILFLALQQQEEKRENIPSQSTLNSDREKLVEEQQIENLPSVSAVANINDSNPDEDFDNTSDDPDYSLTENETSSISGEEANVLPEDLLEPPGTPENLQTPQKRKRSKRRKPELWKQNIRKQKRNSGEGYISVKNVAVRARQPQGTCQNCSLKCEEQIDAEARVVICKDFWNTRDLHRQRDYLALRVKRYESKSSRVAHSRRKFSQTYSLVYLNKTYKVCKKFFLSTLDVSEKMLRTAIAKCQRSNSAIASPDRRGKHAPGKKLSEATMELMEEHINSFPTVPAHWCRKDSSKRYLESILNKERMYSLYIEFCGEKAVKPASRTSYREMLLSKNIGFYQPRKDQCWCYEYEHQTADEKLPRADEFKLHIKRKIAANDSKKQDGDRARNDQSFVAANFDLEAVLYCPLFYAKPIFYKRKLAVYNFTVYEVARKRGHCFLWDEINGKRGANEMATCIEKFINNLPQHVKILSLYSDNCPGQNRNCIVASMLYHSLWNSRSLECVQINFLEVGHTHMECDSMHSTIETASQNAKIYLPVDWYNIIRLAKMKGEPYNVTQLDFHDFLDYKKYREVAMPNTHTSKDGSTLNWKNVRCIKFEKSKPYTLLYKNEYWDEDFIELDMMQTRRGRPRDLNCNIVMENIPSLYTQPQKISQLKYNNLMDLCRDNTIKQIYHHFYKNLPVNSNKPGQEGSSSSDDDDDAAALDTMRNKLFKKKSRKR